MRKRFSKKVIIVINIVIVVLFSIGLYLSTVKGCLLIGVPCQLTALLYTICFGFLSLNIKEDKNNYPTPYFTDRKDALSYVIKRLYAIIRKKENDKIIAIKCDEIEGVGKTEFLYMLQQILTRKNVAKSYLLQPAFNELKKIYRKLGIVHFISFKDDRTVTQINNLPYLIFRQNIVIIDDFESYQTNPFDEMFIIIFCQPSKNNNTNDRTQLTAFSKKDVREMYYAKYKEEIEENFLDSVLAYTAGNVSKITNIFKSEEMCNAFKHDSPLFFSIQTSINDGKYHEATKKLKQLSENTEYKLKGDEEFSYRLKFIGFDLLHYNNQYVAALEGFDKLINESLTNENRFKEIIERKCHIKSHLGHFEEALYYIKSLNDTLKQKSKLVLCLFSYIMTEDSTYLITAKNVFDEMSLTPDLYKSKNKNSFDTYRAVILAYDGDYKTAHEAIDEAISLYTSNNDNNKFVTNCYFIKAEIFRHQSLHQKACEYYQKCLDIYRLNNDFDIYSLVFPLLKYEIQIKNEKYSFYENYSLDETKEMCDEHKMDYNKKIVMYIDELLKLQMENHCDNDDRYKALTNFFEKYIFFIP